jgi:hypothetical protein
MLNEKMSKVAKGEKPKKKNVLLCSQDFMLKELEIKRS